MTPLDLAPIKARENATTPGPWEWWRSYELFDDEGDGKHWGLHNPENPDGGVGDGYWRVVNSFLVTHTTLPANLDGTPLAETPDFQFIAHSREDVPALVAEVEKWRGLRENFEQLESHYPAASLLTESAPPVWKALCSLLAAWRDIDPKLMDSQP